MRDSMNSETPAEGGRATFTAGGGWATSTAGGGRATLLALDREGRPVPRRRAPRKSAIGLAAFMSKVFNE